MSSPNSQLGLGLIGCGTISGSHIRDSQCEKRLRWAAACDLDPDALRARADEWKIPDRYTSVDELLADPAVDAVVIATPPPAHVEPTVAALRAKKHVLVEKPIALTVAEVRQMLEARTEGLVCACCSSRFRATATARRAAEIVASKELGAVRRLVCTALGPPPEKEDGPGPLYLYRPNWGRLGFLGDWGCYDLDFLLGVCGWSLEPQTCLADVRRLHPFYARRRPPLNDLEIQFSAKFSFGSGVAFDFRRASYFAGEPRNEWLIECDDGALDLSMVQKKPPLTIRRYAAGRIDSTVDIEEPDNWSTILGGPVLDFVGAVLDRRPPLTGLEESLIVQRMTDAVYESAESGRAVPV